MATPPFVDPGQGGGGGNSSWLDSLISGGYGILNNLMGQPGGGGGYYGGQPGQGPGFGSHAAPIGYGGGLPGGGPQSPYDVAMGTYGQGNPDDLFLGNADLQASGELQGGYGSAIGNWLNTLGQQTNNQSPYMNLGATSAGSLMGYLQNGTFGPGSLGPVPTFTAPTLADAQNTPGYQFTQQQGNKGILAGAAAAGGNINGGTLKSLGTFDTNLANTTYGDVYNRSLQGYQAQLQGFGTNMAAQNQYFNQLFQPTTLGQTSANNLNANLGVGALSVGNLMSLIGAAQAAGTLGATNDYLGQPRENQPGKNQQSGGSAAPGQQPPIGNNPGGFQYPPIGPIGGPYPGGTPPTLNPPTQVTSTVTYPGEGDNTAGSGESGSGEGSGIPGNGGQGDYGGETGNSSGSGESGAGEGNGIPGNGGNGDYGGETSNNVSTNPVDPFYGNGSTDPNAAYYNAMYGKYYGGGLGGYGGQNGYAARTQPINVAALMARQRMRGQTAIPG